MTEHRWEDLETGAIHLRDKWQFELKSQFIPLQTRGKNIYTQEFFLFIPNTLQINKRTYSKSQFYEDQTTLIRYKTPQFTFEELLDSNNLRSPLTKITSLINHRICDNIEDELKLFGNIFRSTLRDNVKKLVHQIDLEKIQGFRGEFYSETLQLIENLKKSIHLFSKLKESADNISQDCIHVLNSFQYVGEFIDYTTNQFLTRLLAVTRLAKDPSLEYLDKQICGLLLNESVVKNFTKLTKKDSKNKEYVLYRESLLNKYILDSLLLSINRFSIDEKYSNWIGGISAGVAMFIYFCLFIWLGQVFIIDSIPFILFTVVFYILKDRIKEWMKQQFYQQAFKLLFDYRTEIRTYDKDRKLGILKETFSFLDEKKLSLEIVRMRNKEFHEVLESFPRPESVFYYKRVLEINKLAKLAPRRNQLNIIYRFNIHRFILKASDPFETSLALDPNTLKLVTLRLPKVYHLNLIIKNTYHDLDKKTKVEFNKLRILLDKNGIKRIEQL